MLCTSHIVWTVIVPNSSWDIKNLLFLAEAFFPLVGVVSRKLKKSASLEYASYFGCIEVVQWLVKHRKYDENAALHAFVTCCSCGHLSLAKLLSRTFIFCNNSMWPHNYSTSHRESPLTVACESGQLNVIKWLVKHYATSTLEIEEAFTAACSGGHLQVSQWLSARFEKHISNLMQRTVTPFINTCSGGNQEVAEWLAKQYNLTKADAQGDENAAFRFACSQGRIELAQWLTATFSLTVDDARALNNFALRRSSFNGHFKTVQWLVETFNLALTDVRCSNDFCIVRSPYEIGQWLVTRFNIPVSYECYYGYKKIIAAH